MQSIVPLLTEDSASSVDIYHLMQLAADGDCESASQFYRAFFQTEFFALERIKSSGTNDAVRYPHDLFMLQAVISDGVPCIPIFSSEIRAKGWASSRAILRLTKGEHILSIVPENWQILLDAGQPVEKDFSPWEISMLKQGVESIPEIVNEIFNQPPLTAPLSILPVDPNNYQSLINCLSEEAENQRLVHQLYLLKELHLGETEQPEETLILGIVVARQARAEKDKIVERLESLAKLAQIGAESIRVFSSIEGDQNLMVELLKKGLPFYTRKLGGYTVRGSLDFFSRAFR